MMISMLSRDSSINSLEVCYYSRASRYVLKRPLDVARVQRKHMAKLNLGKWSEISVVVGSHVLTLRSKCRHLNKQISKDDDDDETRVDEITTFE